MNDRSLTAPESVDRSRATGPRSRARLRPIDLALVVGCSIVVAATLVVWTGVVPSDLYPMSPAQWSIEVPTCTFNASSYVQHAFPLWATVHLRWVAVGGLVWYIVQAKGTTFLSESGTNGSGSFVSDSYPVAFWALSLSPANTSSCPPILVLTTVTYSL